MKYISLDIETTGLDPLTCDVLEVGAYLEDTLVLKPREQLPCFHCYIWKENYRGEAYALQMNQRIFQKILELHKQWLAGKYTQETITSPDGVADGFGTWLDNHADYNDGKRGTFVIAGKNIAGFDIPFLNQLPAWEESFRFHHRVIDPGMMYFDAIKDTVPPDLKECKERAHLPKDVSHEALDDAWDVIQLVRYKHHV